MVGGWRPLLGDCGVGRDRFWNACVAVDKQVGIWEQAARNAKTVGFEIFELTVKGKDAT